MTQYHATLIDETGCEFGVTIDIDDGVENVTQYIREMYPESKLVVVDHASNFVEVWAKISSVGDMY